MAATLASEDSVVIEAHPSRKVSVMAFTFRHIRSSLLDQKQFDIRNWKAPIIRSTLFESF